MATPYDKVYNNVLPKFKDFDIPNMTENDIKEMLHEHLSPSIVNFHICKKNLSDRDDILQIFNDNLNDDEIEILSNFILISYIDSNYIRVPTLLKVNMSSKDFNSFSPANFLDKLVFMSNTYLSRNETLLSRYAWKKTK